MSRLGRLSQPLSPAQPRIGYIATDEKAYDRARGQAYPWRKWYYTKRWKLLRMRVFERDGFRCRMCGRLEGDTSKLVADHIEPHRGDPAKFWDEGGNVQTLCKPCHDGDKQKLERAGVA